MSKYDNVEPKEKWEFDKSVTDVFENMLERSIPDYANMRKLTVQMCDSLILKKLPRFTMLDLGCSNGLNTSVFIEKYKNNGHYVCVDCSQPMLDDFKDRYPALIQSGILDIKNIDLRKDFPTGYYDVVTSILTVLFIPIQYRQSIIQKIYDNLTYGGVFIFVEKVLGNSANIDDALVENYYAMKKENGYTEEQIERKRLSLEGVQVPVTSLWNIDLLKQAGFRQVDTFWRHLNFEGYVAIK